MSEEKILLNATLCLLIKRNRILLARKMGKIGKGRRNGYGGGIEQGESPRDAAPREVGEESGLTVKPEDLHKVAVIDFHNDLTDGGKFTCRVHIYFVYEWKGRPKNTKEMRNPRFFRKDKLPFGKMMPADKIWLPIVLSGKKIIAEFHLGPFQQELLPGMKITEVESFEE